MQAMLIEEDPGSRARAAQALTRAGFEVTVAGSVDAAKAAVRRGIVDVLVMAERVGGRLAHDVALLAELRNPGLGTILLSDRTAAEADEIFDLLPSLHAVLGRGTPARTLADLAVAAARFQGHPSPTDGFLPASWPEGASTSLRPAEAPSDLDADERGVLRSGVDVPVLASPPAEPCAPDRPMPDGVRFCGLDPADLAESDQESAAMPERASDEASAAAAGPAPMAPRTMPPPHPAPAVVPSFLLFAGLGLDSRVEQLGAVPAAEPEVALAPPRASTPRRLHLA